MDEFIVIDHDQIVVRDNLYLAFFRKVPFVKMVEGAAAVFERWLGMVPENTLNWCVLSESQEEYKPFTSAQLNRCRKLLTESSASKKNVHIDLVGPQPYGADYRIQVWGRKEPEQDGYLDETNLIEMRFPIGFLDVCGVDAFVELASDCFEILECDSGHGTFGYSAGSDADYDKAAAHVVGRAFRYPGFDIAENLDASMVLGNRCRGARWLTMLSNELIEEVGGQAKLVGLADNGIKIVKLKGGLMLRTGDRPEIGDTNRNVKVPMLSVIAKAIEPVTYFHDNGLLPILNHDPDIRDRWERRFWLDED